MKFAFNNSMFYYIGASVAYKIAILYFLLFGSIDIYDLRYILAFFVTEAIFIQLRIIKKYF